VGEHPVGLADAVGRAHELLVQVALHAKDDDGKGEQWVGREKVSGEQAHRPMGSACE